MVGLDAESAGGDGNQRGVVAPTSAADVRVVAFDTNVILAALACILPMARE